MNNEKWVYMFGDEDMSEFFETKEDAISEGLSVHGEDEWSSEKELSVGIFVPYKPFINVDGLIERWQEDVYDDYSECRGYDTYLEDITDEQTKELQDELNKVLQEWIKKHNLEANFGEIHNVEFIEEPLIDSCSN